MPDVNLLAVLVSAVVVFLVGFAYYAAVGDRLAEVSDATPAPPASNRRPGRWPSNSGAA